MKFILIAIAVSFSLNVFSQNIDIQKIDSFVSHIENNNRGIGSVSIFKDGKEVYGRSFGQSNLTDVDYNTDTKYQIGSITKMITATLVFKLIESNQLRLEDKLSKFYPNIPNADKITIKNMMEHTSGLGDYTKKDDSTTWLAKKVTEKEIFDEIIKQGVSFQPNEKVSYSNSAYFLLTKIVEILFKKDYSTIVETEIAQPLGLKNLQSITSKTKNIFPSYGYNEKWEKMTDFEFSNIIGVGDIVSTTKDLNIFLYHLFHYKILKKQSIKQMKPDYRKKETFGRGLMLIPFYEHISYGHGGSTYGTQSIVSYNEKDNLGFSFSINGERFPRNDFAIGILSIIYDKSYEFPVFKTYDLTSENLDKYLGVYASKQISLKITITKDRNTLIAQGTGQPSFPLEATDKDKFKFDKAGAKFEFNPAENTMILFQGGRRIKFTKE